MPKFPNMKLSNEKIILFFVVIVLFAGVCYLIYSFTEGASQVEESPPAYFGEFIMLPEGDNFVVRFAFTDSEGHYVTNEGTAKIKVISADGDTVFEGSFDVTKSDFRTFKNLLTGEVGPRCEINIPMSKFKKTKSPSGVAHLSFTGFPDTLEAPVVGLPVFTVEDLSREKENNFLKNSEKLNLSLEDNGLRIELLRLGVYDRGYSTEDYVLRLDIKITNSTEKIYVLDTYNSSVLVCKDRTTSKETRGDILSEFINSIPDKVGTYENVEGSLFFEPKCDYAQVKGVVLFDKYLFNLETNQAMTKEELVKTSYETSAKEIGLTFEDEQTKITLLRGGEFLFEDWFGMKKGYRIDLKVINKLNDEQTILTFQNSYILDNDNVRYVPLDAEIDLENMPPSSERTGYIVFELPSDINQIFKIVLFDRYIFDFKENKAYTVEQKKEEEYLKNAITINKSVKRGYFSIQVFRAGPFIIDNVEKFRVDIAVKNVTGDPQYFYSSGAALIDNLGNQYDATYHSDMFGKIYPNIIKKGKIIFDKIDEKATTGKLYFDCGYEELWQAVSCTVSIPLK